MRAKLKRFLFAPLPIRNSKGFSLIGVMVSAVIGLVVIGGITNLFVNMNSQIQQVENRADLRNITTLVESALRDQTGCFNTLNPFKRYLWNNVSGSGKFDFGIIKNANNDTIFDLSTAGTRQSLEWKYGLSASVTLKAECVSSTCKDCSVSSNFTGSPASCDNAWSISLISQRSVRGVTIFNKPQHLATVRVSFTDPSNLRSWECNGIALAPLFASSLGLGSLDCINVKKTGVTLVGCGTTQNNIKSLSPAFGFNAGGSEVSGKNLYVGNNTGPSSTGAGNNFVGSYAGYSNTKGKYNTFVGYQTGYKNTKGKYNSFLGAQAGYSNTEGDYNNFFGYQAGYSNIKTDYNNFFGSQAGYSNTKGEKNNFLGYQAGYSNTEGKLNNFFGYQAGYSNTKADSNSFFGHQAGYSNTEAEKNNFFGYQAGYSNTKGEGNNFVGYQAGYTNTKGKSNNFFGYQAGYSNTEADSNSFFGHQAGYSNTKGKKNNFFGYQAGYSNTKTDDNNFFGYQAGYFNTTGESNSFFGSQAGYRNTKGSYNVFLGQQAGYPNTTGTRNVFVGYQTGYANTTGSDNIFIGYNAASGSGYRTAGNRLVIGNNTDSDWIVGEIGTKTISVNGQRFCLQDGSGCTPSSRFLKERIKPFTNFNKALEDILKTPLFTYRYKKDPLKKDRMGIISEELPISLQVKERGKLSRPDWPGIYGALWAGLKGLYHRFEELKKELSSRLEKSEKSFLKDLSRMRDRIKEFVKNTAQFQTRLSAGLDKAERELNFTGKQLSEVKKESSETKKESFETKQRLKDTQNNLVQMMESQKFLLEENNKLKAELSILKERIKETCK